MNERIRELYEQSLEEKFQYGGAGAKPGEMYSNYVYVLNAEKFAELIVKECVGIADEYDGVGSTIVSRIKQHFGVE